MFSFNLFRRLSKKMDNIIEELSELCFDLGDTLRHEKDEDKKKKLLRKHLEKVTLLNKNNKCKIPDFLPGLEWINVREPLSLYSHLKGKVVILDFFTYCCINCMHILPDLKNLEQQFPIEDGLVVVGVHSAKFTNERITNNILSAVNRYEIKHPVVNDNKEAMWKALAIHCWPTIYVIGPEGEPLLFLQGEGHYDTMRIFISQALEYYNNCGLLSHNKLNDIINISFNKSVVQSNVNNNILLYPGKVTISQSGSLIAISDSGHHRILVTDLNSGDLLHEIGGPTAGLADGDFGEARFFSPQGLAFLSDNILFVADTENHCIRQIDLSTETVITIVGDGRQGRDYQGGKVNMLQQISSPWDLCLSSDGKICFIAMAGTHQIWAYFLEDCVLWKRDHKMGTCSAVIGSGREENRNNHYPMSAGLAQPSGLTYKPPQNDNVEGGCLYIADSESSTIRQIDLHLGRVTGLVGGARDARNLFAYGDADGTGLDVKLQHPLGVAYCTLDGKLYVADTYNNKIKIIDVAMKASSTFKYRQELKLNEPGGLCVHGDTIYIADTNNSCIRILNIFDKNISTLQLKEKMKSGAEKKKVVMESSAKLNSKGSDLHLSVAVELSDGNSLTEGAPSKWILTANGGRRLSEITLDEFSLNPKWDIPVMKEQYKELIIDGRIFICTKVACTVKEVCMLIKLEYTDNAPSSVDCNVACVL